MLLTTCEAPSYSLYILPNLSLNHAEQIAANFFLTPSIFIIKTYHTRTLTFSLLSIPNYTIFGCKPVIWKLIPTLSEVLEKEDHWNINIALAENQNLTIIPINTSIRPKSTHNMSYGQIRTTQAREFFPADYFDDTTPERIIEYDRSTGLSTLKLPEYDPRNPKKYLTPKTLVIAVDGACQNTGVPLATKSSFGIFFGPNSPFNTCDTITNPPNGKHTKDIAKLMSFLHALELIKHQTKLREWILETYSSLKQPYRKVMVAIMVDSPFVYGCLTEGVSDLVEGWIQNQ